MKRLALTTLFVGFAVSLSAIIVSSVLSNWRWMYGAVVVGFVFLFAAAMSLWSPAGDGGMGIYTRRQFKEMYGDKPRVIAEEREASNRSSLACACIAAPNIMIPIIVEIIRHAS